LVFFGCFQGKRGVSQIFVRLAGYPLRGVAGLHVIPCDSQLLWSAGILNPDAFSISVLLVFQDSGLQDIGGCFLISSWVLFRHRVSQYVIISVPPRRWIPVPSGFFAGMTWCAGGCLYTRYNFNASRLWAFPVYFLSLWSHLWGCLGINLLLTLFLFRSDTVRGAFSPTPDLFCILTLFYLISHLN
jgi:hypothetical protein